MAAEASAAPAAAARFPWASMGSLCAVRFATTFAKWSVIPFVPFMVVDFSLVKDAREPGYWAGWLLSADPIGRMLTSFAWGRWSDKHGRRPVLQLGVLLLGVSTLAFGLSPSFEVAVAVRFIGGVASGGNHLVAVAVTEVCAHCPHHQAQAMSLNAAMWGTGVILGPAIGGLLARPTVNYPQHFSAETSIWRDVPYLPPCLCGAVLCLLGLLSTRWLPETSAAVAGAAAAAKVDQAEETEGEEERRSLLETDPAVDSAAAAAAATAFVPGQTAEHVATIVEHATTTAQQQQSGWASFFSFCCEPVPRTVTMISFVQSFFVVGDDNLFPLWSAAPRSGAKHPTTTFVRVAWNLSFWLFWFRTAAGGLGFETSRTGFALGIMGATVVVAQLTIYPVLSKRFGARWTFVLLSVLQVPFFLLQPIAAWFKAGSTIPTTYLLLTINYAVITKTLQKTFHLQSHRP